MIFFIHYFCGQRSFWKNSLGLEVVWGGGSGQAPGESKTLSRGMSTPHSERSNPKAKTTGRVSHQTRSVICCTRGRQKSPRCYLAYSVQRRLNQLEHYWKAVFYWPLEVVASLALRFGNSFNYSSKLGSIWPLPNSLIMKSRILAANHRFGKTKKKNAKCRMRIASSASNCRSLCTFSRRWCITRCDAIGDESQTQSHSVSWLSKP